METKLNLKNKLKDKFSKHNLLEKYSWFLDKLIFLISLWLTIAVFVVYSDNLPNLNCPQYFDKILIGIIIFALIFVTLNLFRFFVYVGIIIGVIYLIFIIFIDVYDDYRDPRKTEQKNIYKIEGQIPKPIQGLLNSYYVDSLEFKFKYYDHKLELLKNEIDSLKKSYKNSINELTRRKRTEYQAPTAQGKIENTASEREINPKKIEK